MNVRTIETLIHRVPFGVRCFDSVTKQTVRSGLTLQVWAQTEKRIMTAFLSASGAYGFEGVPGLREWEYDESVAFPAGRVFTLLGEDVEGRYLPCSQSLDQSNAQKLLPLPLFSAPARPAIPGMTVVRGRVVQKIGTARNAAAYVKIEAQYGVTLPVYTGLSDHRGEFALFLPTPDPKSPASNPAASLQDKTWPLTLTFFYKPGSQRYACLQSDGRVESEVGPSPETLEARRKEGWRCLPDQTSLLTQQTVPVFRTATSATAVSDLVVQVPLGRRAVAETQNSVDKSVWLST